MGRTGTPKKTAATRTLSARPSPAPSLSFSNSADPTPSTSRSASASAEPARPATTNKKAKSASAIPSHLMAGQKRPVEDSPEPKAKSTKKPRSDKPKWSKAEKKARKAALAAGETGISIKGTASKSTSEDEEGQEEGEIQGDFNDLFFMDSTPSVIPAETAYVEAAQESPVKAGAVQGETKMEEKARLLAQEEEDMRIFANEVAATDSEEEDSDDDEDDEEDDEDDGPRPLPYAEDMLYEDEEALQEAIRGKIVDDSAAKVTGRYYKEADLTKSCALCGEQGHSSRDCQHSQCFICGLVDSDHEARNCPVALVCSACGSRGHFARDCTNAAPMRGSHYGARCTLCSSGNHLNVNCPTLWRIYDTTGAKPAKRKIVFACANDGTTRDHFIDDCLLPRGHPLRFADSSAFNRAALGDAAKGLPGPSTSRGGGGATGAASAARRRGGERRPEPEEPADDDWFASRDRNRGDSNSGNGRNTPRGGNGGGNGKGKGGDFGGHRFRPERQDSGRRTHIHFNESSHDRFGGGSPAPRRDDGGRGGYRDMDRDDRGRFEDRDSWRSMYGEDDRGGRSGGGGGGKGNGGGRRGGSGGGGGSGRSSGRGTPSLASRIEGGGGGGGNRPSPRYQGGYY